MYPSSSKADKMLGFIKRTAVSCSVHCWVLRRIPRAEW